MCSKCSSVTGDSSIPVSVGLVAESVTALWLGNSGLDCSIPYPTVSGASGVKSHFIGAQL